MTDLGCHVSGPTARSRARKPALPRRRLWVVAVVLAVTGCTGAGAKVEEGGPPSSPAPPSSPPTKADPEAALGEASLTFSRYTRQYDEALDALYAELNKSKPSMPTLRDLANSTRRACLVFAADLENTAWPDDLEPLAADLAREISDLAVFYHRMGQSATARVAAHIAEVIDRRYDRAPAARMRYALDPAN